MAHEIQAQCGQILKVFDKADRPKWQSIPQYELWIRELERTPCESCSAQS
jgi:hypothetical protein